MRYFCDGGAFFLELIHEYMTFTRDYSLLEEKVCWLERDEETVKRKFSISKWEDCFNGIYLSDHYPILLEIDMN